MQQGKINFFKTYHFLCVTVVLRLNNFLISNTQSERHAIKLLIKVQISSDLPLSNTN